MTELQKLCESIKIIAAAHFGYLERIEAKVDRLIEQGEKLMALVVVDKAQIDALVATIATLKTDEGTVLADVAAALKAALPTADPATAAVMTTAISDLTKADTDLKAADPGTPSTAPAPPGTPVP